MACIDTEEVGGGGGFRGQVEMKGDIRQVMNPVRETDRFLNVIASFKKKGGAGVKTHLFKSSEAKEWAEVGYPTNSDEVDFDPSIGIKLKYTRTLSLTH